MRHLKFHICPRYRSYGARSEHKIASLAQLETISSSRELGMSDFVARPQVSYTSIEVTVKTVRNSVFLEEIRVVAA